MRAIRHDYCAVQVDHVSIERMDFSQHHAAVPADKLSALAALKGDEVGCTGNFEMRQPASRDYELSRFPWIHRLKPGKLRP